jgi:Uncharacterised nucleotidyltransferase
MRTLLQLLRGEKPGAAAEDWMNALDLAEEENILPWAAACLRAQVDCRAHELDARLRAIDRTARISAFVWSQSLRSTLAEFHRRSVPAISLKGPWLAQRLYGDSALRLYADLDLLVRRSDFARSEEMLSGLGFSADRRREDYARTWSRGSITLELHDDVENPLAFDFGIEAAWNRAQLAEFEGVPAWLLAPCDELRFLCLHGARHRFERLSHVLDLVLAFRRFAALPSCAPLEASQDSQRLLALGCMMAARLDPQLAEVEAAYTSIPDRRSLEETSQRLWQERMQEPAPMLDWRAKHRFLLSIERRGWDRLRARVRHLRILSTRLIHADFAFAARFHLYRTWQVWMLRPVRLMLRGSRGLPEIS